MDHSTPIRDVLKIGETLNEVQSCRKVLFFSFFLGVVYFYRNFNCNTVRSESGNLSDGETNEDKPSVYCQGTLLSFVVLTRSGFSFLFVRVFFSTFPLQTSLVLFTVLYRDMISHCTFTPFLLRSPSHRSEGSLVSSFLRRPIADRSNRDRLVSSLTELYCTSSSSSARCLVLCRYNTTRANVQWCMRMYSHFWHAPHCRYR